MIRQHLQVTLRNYQRKWRIKGPFVTSFLRKIWREIPTKKRPAPEKSEVTVVFLNDKQIRCYNNEFRKKDYPTDVLSFPVNASMEGDHYLGDILISLERTASQALEKRHTMEKELKILLLHGILHLLGYDHESDSGQMDRLERQLRKVVL